MLSSCSVKGLHLLLKSCTPFGRFLFSFLLIHQHEFLFAATAFVFCKLGLKKKL